MGTGEYYIPCSADNEQDWQPYTVDPYSAICDDYTHILCTLSPCNNMPVKHSSFARDMLDYITKKANLSQF